MFHQKNGFQPKTSKSKAGASNVKALLLEDIEDQDENETVSSDGSVAEYNKSKCSVTPVLQRRRPVLARAAKAAPKISVVDDVIVEEEEEEEEEETN